MYYKHEKRNGRTKSETVDLRIKNQELCCDGKNIASRFVFLYTEYVFWYILPYVRLGYLPFFLHKNLNGFQIFLATICVCSQNCFVL
jgi:hypothetical protein